MTEQNTETDYEDYDLTDYIEELNNREKEPTSTQEEGEEELGLTEADEELVKAYQEFIQKVDQLEEPNTETFWKKAHLPNNQLDFNKLKEAYQTDDNVNHPRHYTSGYEETIVKFENIYGTEATIIACLFNIFKYEERATLKGNYEEDMQKAKFYYNHAKNLTAKRGTTNHLQGFVNP